MVAYDVSSVPEVVEDAGLLVPVGDNDAFIEAIWRLLSEPGLRNFYAEKGPEQMAKFTWAEAAKNMIAVYEETLTRFS